MRIKICGLMDASQAQAIAQIGIQALGFIGVPSSKRYLPPLQMRALTQDLPPFVARIGVFADVPLAQLLALVPTLGLNGVQLHGNESPDYCAQVRAHLPGYELIKAVRLESPTQLAALSAYNPHISALLLDAYAPDALGGTGQVLDWSQLVGFKPGVPWILAGGLTPDNVKTALAIVQPDAIDLSSGVEHRPGDKDLTRIQLLWQRIVN